MDVLHRVLKWSALSHRVDDDRFDRLSHRYSTAVLIAATLLTGGRQIIGERIRCFVPAEFSQYHRALYINDYCYVANTYYVPFDENLPQPDLPRKHQVNYYQWVTLFTLVQALLFMAPVTFWRLFCGDVGSQVDCLVKGVRKLSRDTKTFSLDNYKNNIQALVISTDRFLKSRKALAAQVLCRRHKHCRPMMGLFISIFSLIIKLLYLLNSVGQMFLLNKFLGDSGYILWGFKVIKELVNTGKMSFSETFPLVTICDLDLFAMGSNVHSYTVQCVLTINVFHDRVYLLIWLWLFLVSLMTLAGILLWFKLHCFQYSFIKNHLHRTLRCVDDKDYFFLKEFNEEYLSLDGTFLLKMVYVNSRCVEFDELVAGLWDYFLKNRNNRRTIMEHDPQLDLTLVEKGYKFKQVDDADSEGDGPTAYF